MNEQYEILKNVDIILRGESTKFLDGKMQKEVSKRLKKRDYQVYHPYPDSEKVIFYTIKKPNVVLFEIKSKKEFKHQEILGSIFALGVSASSFGDILILDGHSYFYVLEEMKGFFQTHFREIGRNTIELEEKPLSILESFQRSYEEIDFIVTSERVDTILSHIMHTNREQVKEKMASKEIILNYEVLKNPSKLLEKGDIFSIRRYGKFLYGGVLKETKKGNFIVKCYKYL